MKANQVNSNLMRILQDNKNSDSGMSMDFRYIKIVNGFRHLVPISVYDNIAPLIELTTRIGETGIYTSHPLIGYSLTSGTTGVPRYIPCTQKHIEDFQREFLSIIEKGRTMLLLESLPKDTKFVDNVYLDSISGILLQSLKKKMKWHNIVNPEPLVYISEHMDSEYLRAFFALRDATIIQIFSPFSWGVVNFFDCIRKNWDKLLDDIRKGSIDPSVKLPEELGNELKKYIKRAPERAENLKALYHDGFFAGAWVEKIWPDMKRIIAGGGGSFSIYSRRMQRNLGKIVHNYGLYASSEGVIGCAVKDGTDLYRIADSSLFLEFIPVNENSDVSLLADELEPGKYYRVIVTNNAGLYRYNIGDVIKVIDMKDGIPYFKIAYRKEASVLIEDVVITEENIFDAICKMEDKFEILIADYSFGSENNKCKIFLEPEAYDSNIQKLNNIPLEEIAKFMKGVLLKDQAETDCEVYISQEQTQLLYRDLRRYREITALDQIKPVHVLDNPVKEKFFTRMVEG